MRKITKLAAVAAAVLAPSIAAAQGKDIVQTAIDAGTFKTLVTAVQAAGLVETLKGPGPFTVFAPSDAAFAKIPKATLDALVADKGALTSVLTYHVLQGKVMAADVLKMGKGAPKTVNGKTLAIEVRNGKVYVDGAQVVTTDIVTSNGVIHVIDSVVMPK